MSRLYCDILHISYLTSFDAGCLVEGLQAVAEDARISRILGGFLEKGDGGLFVQATSLLSKLATESECAL